MFTLIFLINGLRGGCCRPRCWRHGSSLDSFLESCKQVVGCWQHKNPAPHRATIVYASHCSHFNALVGQLSQWKESFFMPVLPCELTVISPCKIRWGCVRVCVLHQCLASFWKYFPWQSYLDSMQTPLCWPCQRLQTHPENPVQIPRIWAKDSQQLVCFLAQVVRRNYGVSQKALHQQEKGQMWAEMTAKREYGCWVWGRMNC